MNVCAVNVNVLGHLSTRKNITTPNLKVSGDCTIRGYCQANQINNLGSLRVQSIQADHIQSSGYLSVAQEATTTSLHAEGAVALFIIPILSVWTVGSFVCAVIAVIGGILGTFGFHEIGLNGSSDYDLPDALSLPFGIFLSLLLFLSFYYTRRLLQKSLHFMKI